MLTCTWEAFWKPPSPERSWEKRLPKSSVTSLRGSREAIGTFTAKGRSRTPVILRCHNLRKFKKSHSLDYSVQTPTIATASMSNRRRLIYHITLVTNRNRATLIKYRALI
uniref:(northern house mosquito) hypothetical protein n=1 Tax=Culex pipiens TaxID=7175 RepID=A0A8D8HP84_CULPI